MTDSGQSARNAAAIRRQAALDAVRILIEYLGENPDAGDLVETPRRVVDMFDELLNKHAEPFDASTFELAHYNDLVIVRDIPIHSLCRHHLLPWHGVAHVAYLPEGRVLGLSKFARIVQKIQAGLTIQEQVTHDVAVAVQQAASPDPVNQPIAVAVVTEAQHTCMINRGARAIGSNTMASTMLGAFRTNATLRAEFLQLLRDPRG